MYSEMMIFAVVFIGQIWLVSNYFPRQAVQRMRQLLDGHPPADYPKLYPRPIEHYRIGIAAFEWMNRVILMFGVGILLSVLFLVDHANFADDGHISEFWPMLFGVLQFVPWLVLEIVGYGQFKLMREAQSSSTRRADLQPRRLLDMVSPGWLAAAVTIAIASVLFDFYVHDFELAWNESMQRTLVLVLTNGFMAALGVWNIYGRKMDPHQKASDRRLQTSVQLKSMLLVSMAMSWFFAAQAAGDLVDLGAIEASLLSLYFIVVASMSLGFTMSRLRPEDINFEVYRNTPGAS
jgi:hypothetical protein